MRIKLHFPAESIAKITAMGLRQASPETLRLVTDHPASRYGIGVILRGKSGQQLSGRQFAPLVRTFGAWIECDSEQTAQRVRKAMAIPWTDMDDFIRVAT